MKARTKRRITETVVGLFSVAAVVLTFKIFVIPATRGEKVRLRFMPVTPDTMGGETIRTGSRGLEASKPPHRSARSGIPAPLAGLRLPSDPDELPDVLISRRISIFRILERACPAGHEWVRRALSALEDRAESDTLVRKELRGHMEAVSFPEKSRVIWTASRPGFDNSSGQVGKTACWVIRRLPATTAC